MSQHYDNKTVQHWLHQMQAELFPIVSADPEIGLIAIRSGGVEVAQVLHQRLGVKQPLGELNIAFYRDDFSRIGLHPQVGASDVPFDVENRHIILIDDVLSTGRTVRAAMNEIFDWGRPARITLAVLVQRHGHELPIRADVQGVELNVAPEEHVELDLQSMSISVGARES